MENTLNSRKNRKILSVYTENNFWFFRCYNYAQKLDNAVQIGTITSHAWRRKVDLGE